MTRIATFQACDEVALAGPGKFAFIGIYGSEVMVPVLPFTLAQLFFVVNFRTPINDRPKQVKVRIERPGREPFIVDNSAPLKTPSTPSPDANFYQYQTVARIAPFEIDKEGIVRVFVEDELGDNYAGGLRLKVGIHPELGVPQVALGANLIVGHYKRLANCPKSVRQEAAAQLIEDLSAYITHLGQPIGLQYPESDVRFVLDNKRIHVLFPQPLDTDRPIINLEPIGNFESCEIERADRIGFVVKFEPSAPADSLFNYTVVENPKGISKNKVPDKTKEKGRLGSARPKKSPE